MLQTRPPLRLLALGGAEQSAQRIAERLESSLLRRGETWFSCGEGKVAIQDNVRGCSVYILAAMVAPGSPRSIYDQLVMCLNAVEAARLGDAAEITVVSPYFPGARQDKRKGRTREGIAAGLVARMFEAAGCDRVISVEIHNEAIAGMFDPRRCVLENLYLHRQLAPWLREQGLCGDTVVSPDVGGLERARRYAETLNLAIATLSKERDYSRPNTVTSSSLLGEVAGHDVLMVDDIVDTAGSAVAAVDTLKEEGAKDITLACVHPVLSGPAFERLSAVHARAVAEGWRFSVVGTSAVQQPLAPPWYRSFDLEPLLARVIRSIHQGGSVTRVQETLQ
ncbi:MAG: ribose-phosphate pyrophosphokinase [Myxococcota bacterium]|nr:ribose-phosphate pyrophosphokinase [Myxococcota bacterium]